MITGLPPLGRVMWLHWYSLTNSFIQTQGNVLKRGLSTAAHHHPLPLVVGAASFVSASGTVPDTITHVPHTNTVAVFLCGLTCPTKCATLRLDLFEGEEVFNFQMLWNFFGRRKIGLGMFRSSLFVVLKIKVIRLTTDPCIAHCWLVLCIYHCYIVFLIEMRATRSRIQGWPYATRTIVMC